MNARDSSDAHCLFQCPLREQGLIKREGMFNSHMHSDSIDGEI